MTDVQGNPAFGPLPTESDPNDFLAANSAGTTPLMGFERELRGGPKVDELGGERSMRRRGRVSAGSVELDLEDEMEGDEENVDMGEGSTMDLEDD